jgi:hypothetical protein
MKGEKRLPKKEMQWEWRKKYRVWDANRKIFVYPENWIEPELRLTTAFRASLRKAVAFICTECRTEMTRTCTRKPARTKGVCVLFIGKSRSCALVAAQTLARDLEINLYRVDLSSVVSKYIGETEKNLRRVFDAAEKGGAVLLLDEAGALFGKRTEVKDSHDRYANIEVNYLLQRIEGFGGLVILSTGSRGEADDAFWRRFHFLIGCLERDNKVATRPRLPRRCK